MLLQEVHAWYASRPRALNALNVTCPCAVNAQIANCSCALDALNVNFPYTVRPKCLNCRYLEVEYWVLMASRKEEGEAEGTSLNRGDCLKPTWAGGCH
jgi:hypothetical protein